MLRANTTEHYRAAADRYDSMHYARAGRSGLKLPRLSLGLWQNFGEADTLANGRAMVRTAFDNGITHFDLANNYGPPHGAAETVFGRIFQDDLRPYRDEILVSTKAGYDMWAGPYGAGGSRKSLLASCDMSLKRCGLDYFDIFYHHCPDPETPLEETMAALDHIVRTGRALYVGVSNYGPQLTRDAAEILRDLGTPLVIHQPRYNMFDRSIEQGLGDVLIEQSIGAIVFSPLAQGLLSEKYLNGIPADSRAARPEIRHLTTADIDADKIAKVRALQRVAQARGQSLSQMAVSWVLAHPAVSSCLIGARHSDHIRQALGSLAASTFDDADLGEIEAILAR